METSTIILAGGFGERTKGILGTTPKILIKTADGKTILDHILDDLNASGLRTTIITNGLFFDQIEKYVQERQLEGSVEVKNDQKMIPEERLGALGDLLFAIDSGKVDQEDVLVLPSDTAYWESFSIKEFLDFAETRPDDFVTVVYDVGDKEKIKRNLGCVVLDDDSRIKEFEEKPLDPKSTLAIVAIYLFRPKHMMLLREFKENGGNLNSPSNIIPFLMNKGIKISTFLSTGHVIDANSPEEISKAGKY